MHKEYPKCFSIKSKENLILSDSSSGGFFTVIATYVIQNKGIVYGAVYDDNFQVIHEGIDAIDELYRMRGSKYVQSKQGDCFSDIKAELEKDRLVLYTGTSCQVAALKAYLGKEYENLITADIICHGVPSPRLWKAYLEFQEKKHNSKLVNAKFRDKYYGWLNYSMLLTFQNGKIYRKKVQDDPYMRMFLQNGFLRPCCYECRFKSLSKPSDFTMSDHWKVRHSCPEFDDDKGTSLLFCNNSKSIILLQSISPLLMCKEITIEQALYENPAVTKASQRPSNRCQTFPLLDTEPFLKVYKQTCVPLWRDKYRRLKLKLKGI